MAALEWNLSVAELIYDYVGGFFHRVQARDLRRIGIGNYGDPAALYPETSVSVPLDLHALSTSSVCKSLFWLQRSPRCF
jgi:hypothetical protein